MCGDEVDVFIGQLRSVVDLHVAVEVKGEWV